MSSEKYLWIVFSASFQPSLCNQNPKLFYVDPLLYAHSNGQGADEVYPECWMWHPRPHELKILREKYDPLRLIL